MKVVIAPLADKDASKIGYKRTNVRRRKVRDAEGNAVTSYTVDFGSETIDRDLTWVFGRNVAKARQENKRVTGSPDGVRKK